jgi:hypothetical protein
MARNKRRGGRVTPKGTRPPHLRPVGGVQSDGSPVDSIIDSGGRELLLEDDPVAAETWASALLDMFEGARSQARLDGMEVPPFEESLLLRCQQRRDKRAVAVAAALAGVLPPPHDHLATTVISDLREVVAGVPSWVGRVGRTTPTESWLASDVFGDQDSLIVGFGQEGAPGEHALVVLVDHNLSGQAKDAWIGADFHEVVASWKSVADRHMRMAEVPIEEALGQLRDAVAMSDLWNGDTDLRTEDFARHRALIRARLRRTGLTEDRPSDIQVDLVEREHLVREFMASSHGRGLSGSLATVDVELLAHHLVDLRSDYEGRPLRWSPTVVSLLLGDLAPRKLLLDADEAANLPTVVRAFVRFSADRSGLDGVFVDETLATVDEVEPGFLGRIGDPATAGPAKAVLAALQARGVDLSDVDAINEAFQLGDPMQLPRAAPKKRRRTDVAPADVVASAEPSPVLGRLGVLATFYGDGRRLTQTGQPTLADAKELVALLGTRDQIDPTYGDRTFKTRSAAELRELGFTIRWAVVAGALRKEHGKLRATAAWRNLDPRPLERWMKAADALPSLGPLAAYHANNRYRGRNEILDDLAPDILHMLVPRPMPFDEMLDRVCDRADAEYEWIAPYMKDARQRRTSFDWDLALLAQILGWAGIAERVGAEVRPDLYERDRLVGGMLQLTMVGRWWLGGTSAR